MNECLSDERSVCRMIEKKVTMTNRMISSVVAVIMATSALNAADWPTHLHDNHRSGFTAEQLQLPLRQQWVITTNRPPRPAWSETPALQNFWASTYDHRSRVNVDKAFRVVVAGRRLYYGSSSSDKVVCRSTIDGSLVWRFIAGGPVRFAPTVSSGRIYFGTDDGYAYCLDAGNGQLIWKHRPEFAAKTMMISSRLSSVCPVRTAILVDDGIAYWGAGLVSGAQTGLRRYVIAADAETGKVLWTKAAPKPLQGYPLASTKNLYMPAGKSTPVSFRKSDGLYLGAFGAANSRQGGAYAVLSSDNKLYFGPHYGGEGSYIGEYDAESRAEEAVAWGPGNHLVVTPSHAYYSSDTTISKIYRSTKQVAWNVPCNYPYELILAKDVLFAGGEDEVGALSISNGNILWTAPVKGRVHSLAVADSRLFVSTNRGTIHCFRAATAPIRTLSQRRSDW